jgi:hypothetical protein
MVFVSALADRDKGELVNLVIELADLLKEREWTVDREDWSNCTACGVDSRPSEETKPHRKSCKLAHALRAAGAEVNIEGDDQL